MQNNTDIIVAYKDKEGRKRRVKDEAVITRAVNSALTDSLVKATLDAFPEIEVYGIMLNGKCQENKAEGECE